MIYGDDPQQINEREDKLGLTTYTTLPDMLAISQSGNLYGYCVGNPLRYRDLSGYQIELFVPDAVPIGAIYTGFPWKSVSVTGMVLWLFGSFCGNKSETSNEPHGDSLPEEQKGQSDSKDVDNKENKGDVFPENPDDFHPEGLTRKEYQTPNGKVIKWVDESGKAVYEWDEDLKHGSHYHHLGEDGKTRIPGENGDTHLRPGDRYK